MWTKMSVSMATFFVVITAGYMMRDDGATARKELEAEYTKYAQFLETHPPNINSGE